MVQDQIKHTMQTLYFRSKVFGLSRRSHLLNVQSSSADCTVSSFSVVGVVRDARKFKLFYIFYEGTLILALFCFLDVRLLFIVQPNILARTATVHLQLLC